MKRILLYFVTVISIFYINSKNSCLSNSDIGNMVLNESKINSSTRNETYSDPIEPVTVIKACNDMQLSREEKELIALVTMAEAEGECEEGKRLVIDTILNRIDSEYFPNTVYEVIYQKNQFTSIWNGRINDCYVMSSIYQLVEEELCNRTNTEVVFFRAGKYSNYGIPMFQVENHYFSRYE